MKKKILLLFLMLSIASAHAMEKPQKETLAVFLYRMHVKKALLDHRMSKQSEAAVPYAFLRLYETRRPSHQDVKELKSTDNWHIMLLQLNGYSVITAITIASDLIYEKKKDWIALLCSLGISLTLKDKEMIFFMEWQHDPLKFERRWELIKAQRSPNSSFFEWPTEMIVEIIEYVEGSGLLIPKESMFSK